MMSRRSIAVAWLALLLASESNAADLKPGKLGPAFEPQAGSQEPASRSLRPEAQPKLEPADETKISATTAAAVDWSYLRRNAPALVNAMIDQVRVGAAPLHTLGGLAKPATITKVGVGVKPAPRGVAPAPRLGTLSPTAAKLPPVSLRSLLPLEVSPATVQFGNVVDGQKIEKVIYVRNAPRGVGKAVLRKEADSAFRFVSMKVLDGRLERVKEKVSVRPSSAKDPKLLPQYVWQSSPPKIGEGKKRTEVSTEGLLGEPLGPFEVDVDEGATVRLVLAFSPRYAFHGGTTVGRHRGKLELDVGGKTAVVDLDAFFEGVAVGVWIIPPTEETVFAYPKYNDNNASTGFGTALAQKLYASFELTIANPKSESVKIPFSIDARPGVRRP